MYHYSYQKQQQRPGGLGWNRQVKTPSSATKKISPTGSTGIRTTNARRVSYIVNSRRRSFSKVGSKLGGGFGGGGPTKSSVPSYITTPKAVLTAALESGNVVDAATQRGNIKVVVRVRPANDREMGAGRRIVVRAIDSHLVVFDPKEDSIDFFFHGVKQKNCNYLKKPNKDLKFVFDSVYSPIHSNLEIFEGTIKPTIDTVLTGYNCSVFAYGATGSGKTFTMLGDSQENPGLTFLTLTELYTRLEEMRHEYESEISISYLEVYNETVKDLLEPSKPLNVCEDAVAGVVIPGLTKHKPKDAAEILELLRRGNSVRSQHPTDHNSESSRSHAVFMVFVTLRGRYKDLNNNMRAAKLVMVDLAGSERGCATGFAGVRFKEGASINKSLLALGNCINALADGKKHIPYRDSKLTRILKDALGGNCKTVMIANVSPSDLSFEDTYSTLSYADRAKRIKFNVKKNVMTVHAHVAKYGQVVEEMAREIDYYKQVVQDLKKKCKCGVGKCDAGTETEDSILTYRTAKSSLTSISSPRASDNNRFNYLNDEVAVLGSSADAETSPVLNKSFSIPSCESKIAKTCDVTNMESYHHFCRLLQQKIKLETTQNELATSLRDLDWKLKWKSVRLDSAKALEQKESGEGNKGIDRMQNQHDILVAKKKENRNRLTSIQNSIQSVSQQLIVAEQDFVGENITTNLSTGIINRSELVQLKYKEAELLVQKQTQPNFEVSINEIFDKLVKAETTLAKSLQQLKPTHFLLKHYGHTTKESEEKVKDLMNEYCCTRIQFEIGNDETVTLSPFFNFPNNSAIAAASSST